ncbi:MAG: NUDIX hydrolase [Bacillota bacterium]
MIRISDYLSEKTLSRSYLYRGRIINVRQDRVQISGNQVAFREVVEHPGAVAILAIDEENNVVLVKQHRQPAGDILLEIPAGKLEPGEDPLECARREMAEETGLEGASWEELFVFYPSPGFCEEIINIFKVVGLKKVESPASDPEERVTVTKIPLNKTRQMILNGEIKDGKTIIAIQHALIENI